MVAIAVAAVLAGCAGGHSKPIPAGYAGPRAHIADSMAERGGAAADIFYLSAIDGRKIDDSVAMTAKATAGHGRGLVPHIIGRDVPARLSTFTIAGSTQRSAPILALLHRNEDVSGDVQATPAPGHSYIVTGVLGPGYSAVWIQDRVTGAILGRKIEAGTPGSPPQK